MKKQSSSLQSLVDCGRQFYERRWMWGTAGNLSLKMSNNPLTIAITPSGLNKGHLNEEDLMVIKDGAPVPKTPSGTVPSAETIIHQTIHRTFPGCGAVFHVHPIYATLVSSLYGDPKEVRMLRIDWSEMMKGVGVGEEEMAEIAILPNWQDVSLIARDVKNYLTTFKGKVLPVVLIYNHGLTGWGTTPDQARNHLEIMEYVCQYLYLKNLVKR